MSLDAMKQALRAAEFADLCIKELVTGSTNREVAKQVLSEAITALRAAIEQAQEPVAWMCSDESLTHKGYSRFSRTCEGAWNIPVYTAPRQWQGLTDEELNQIYAEPQTHAGQYARAIEAKLRERNT